MEDFDIDAQLNNPKKSLIDGYLEVQKHFETIYGPNTLVVMEVGSFYEVYGVENDEEVIGKPREIADLLNLQLTRKNKSIQENNRKNPLMAGWPSATFDRYISRLVQEKKYTIVVIPQKGIPPNVTRYVDQILSPGIHVDYCKGHADNFITSLLIDEHRGVFSVGYAAMDLSTGKTFLFEGHSTQEDKTAALDELFRLLQSHGTSELIFCAGSSEMDTAKLFDYLELSEFENSHVRSKRLPITYQNELFKKAYAVESFLSPIEYLNLEKQPLTSEALAQLIEFVVDHDVRVIERLKKPTIIDTSNYLYLGNNALEQLNIISRDPRELTVLQLFDHTTTAIGKRLFRDRLTNPITSKDELEARYNLSDWLVPIHEELRSSLKKVYDLERINRRIRLGRLHPFEINFLYESLLATDMILQQVIDQKNPELLPDFVSAAGKLKAYAEHLNAVFSFDETAKVLRHAIQTSLFEPGYHHELDKLNAEHAALEQKLRVIATVYAELLSFANGRDHVDSVQIKQLDKEGHYLSITRSRFGLIEEVIKEKFVSLDGTVYALADFVYKKQKTNVKITSPIIDQISDEIVLVQNKITALVRELFQQELAHLDESFTEALDVFTTSLAKIDVAISNIICSKERRLVRPKIIETAAEESYVSFETLRHPLVESKEEYGIYIPNDIALGTSSYFSEADKQTVIASQSEDPRGLLLYGINSSGKSSLMKSIGVSVLLAQAGLYVPSSKMRFSIFQELFTRIVAKDNFEKGLSSFAVEMIELKNIFNRCGPKSLILGDEISHGTETLSAIAIVGATIKRLTETNSLFIFTTHLHQIHQLGILKDAPHVVSAHMSVHYDEAHDRLVFDRLLKEGSGSTIYGLEFAQSLHMDDTFLKYAMDIRKGLADEYSDIEKLTKKDRSGYNKDLYLTSCAVCKAKVEDVHHISPQKAADEHGNVGHIHKDHKYNLLPICKDCHHKVHKNELKIKGFMMTDSGLELMFDEEN